MSTPQRKLFVFGVGRSGTTALVHVLNSHPQVCVGMERYKYPFTREKVIDPEFFSFERFFDFRETDTNLLPTNDTTAKRLYREMRPRYQDAAIVGDKVPHLLHLIRPLHKAFADSSFIYLLRDASEVASSWHARATNPTDRWPAQNDFRKAVEVWNNMNRGALDLVNEGLPVLILNYNSFFWGDEGDRLLAFLHLEQHGAYQDGYGKASAQFLSGRTRKAPPVVSGQREHVGRNADFSTYEQLLKLSE